MMQKPFISYLIIIFLLPFYAFSQETDLPRRFTLLDPESHSAIVARVGDLEITAGEFVMNYEFGPAFLKRGKNSKKRYLDVIIYEKLLALDGYQQGLLNSAQVKEMLAEIDGDLITEELYKDDVMSQVKVTTEEIEEGVRKNRQHLTLKWLFTEDLQEMVKYKQALDDGAPFDSLFFAQLNDSVVAEDRILEATRFKLQIDNPLLAMVVDTLQANTCSAPIRVNDGWYILKIADSWRNVIITHSETEKQRYEVERAIFKNKADRLSDQYVHEMMLAEEATIIRESLNILLAFLGKLTLRPEKFEAWELSRKLEQEDPNFDISNIRNYEKKVLLKYKSGKVYLKDYFGWYNLRKNYLTFNTQSRNSFSGSVQTTIWQMLRNKLLIERAVRRGLQNREVVQQQKAWWRDKIVYSAMKNQIASTIKVNESKLRAYYAANKKDYKYKNGEFIPFEKARNNVRNDFIREEYMAKIYRRVLMLKQKHAIEIAEEVLAKVRVDNEDAPKAIDVYVVKKDGTFPHQIHPTVDWEWQAFLND